MVYNIYNVFIFIFILIFITCMIIAYDNNNTGYGLHTISGYAYMHMLTCSRIGKVLYLWKIFVIEQGSLPLAYGCANLYICKEQTPRTEWHHSMSVSCNSRWVHAMYDIFSYQNMLEQKSPSERKKRCQTQTHQDAASRSAPSVVEAQMGVSKGQCRRPNSVLVVFNARKKDGLLQSKCRICHQQGW